MDRSHVSQNRSESWAIPLVSIRGWKTPRATTGRGKCYEYEFGSGSNGFQTPSGNARSSRNTAEVTTFGMADTYTLLVAGARNVDAGKTTFATGLVRKIGGIGFKPRAGNDYWYDFDTVNARLEDGRLVGNDAVRLAAASAGSPSAESLNPLHRLWRPIPSGSGTIFGREGSEFLVDRVGDRYVVNETTTLPAELSSALPLEDAVGVSTLEEINRLMADQHQPAVDRLRPRIEEEERVVIESYADVARPIRGIDVDAVAVVGAGSARIYDGDRYCRAAEVASGGPALGRLEERVADVVDLLDPIETVQLPPLEQSVRDDPRATATAYEPAYERLIEAAV